MVGGRGKSVMYVCVSFFSHPGSHTGLKNWAAEMDWGGQVCACVRACVSFPSWLSHWAEKGHRPSPFFPIKRSVGSSALSHLLLPFPLLPTAAEEPWGLIWKFLC